MNKLTCTFRETASNSRMVEHFVLNLCKVKIASIQQGEAVAVDEKPQKQPILVTRWGNKQQTWNKLGY